MPSRRTDLVSVIIVDRGDSAATTESVAATLETDWPADLREVIVVRASDDMSAPFGSPVKTVTYEPGRQHPAMVGAARARGRYLAFLEAGYRPRTEWVRGAVRAFHGGLQIGVVASTVAPGGSRAGFSGGGLTWFGKAYDLTEPGSAASARDLLFATRNAMFVRSSAFSTVGGFDPALVEIYDDVDLGWRMNLAGYRVRLAPESVVDSSERTTPASPDEHVIERNALVLLYKNLEEANLGRFLTGALGLATQRTMTASGLDARTSAEGSATVDMSSFAPLVGVDAFLRRLNDLSPQRSIIQSRRVVGDDALFSLFGEASWLSDSGDQALVSGATLTSALGIVPSRSRIRVLVVTGDLIGPKMAGPAIRAWNMSEQLAYRNEVRLVSTAPPKRASTRFAVLHAAHDRAMEEHEAWADVIIFQGYVMEQFKSIAHSTKIIVADVYDPLHLEQLEQAREDRFEDWNKHVVHAAEVLNRQIARADFLLCASEKQRDFWLGQLAAVGRVNAMTYEADNALRSLIDVAPFGLDPVVPEQTRHAIKGSVPGIGPDDKVLIWGGGIYDWFDTETLIRAMAKVSTTHPNARLFFLGAAHPNPGVPMMRAQAHTFELSDSLGLTDRVVFFNRDWVAFDDRHNYLLDADAGVSTHYEHIETAFSFRTRILDYLWARLPMVTTRGDGFADLIDDAPLGVTVVEQDVDALADAIIQVLYDEEFRATARARIETARENFAWSRALEPLTSFCASPRLAPDHRRSQHTHVLRLPDPAADAIRASHHGLAKYARLSALYLRREGVMGFVNRAKFRLGL